MKRPPKNLINLLKVGHRKNGDGFIGGGLIRVIAWVPDEPGGEIGAIAYYDVAGSLIGFQRVQVIYECPVCNEHCQDRETANNHCEQICQTSQ